MLSWTQKSECLCTAYPLETGEVTAGSYYVKEITRISHFCRASESVFQRLAGPRNVSVDLKYDVLLCCVLYIRLSQEK